MQPATGFDERYRAIQTRDRRFDGQFVTAVRSTGIYCRPSCPARTPKPANVTFFATSAAAHQAGYRACKRCLPESTPGTPAWNLRGDVAARAMRLIADGVVDREGVPGLASRLGYSTRHLTRLLTEQLGAGPLALSRAHRAQTARTLLTSTALPIGDVAYASGFASVRQFNDTVGEIFDLTPTELRTRAGGAAAATSGAIDLVLPVRPPHDAAWVLAWLARRAVPGVEVGIASAYARAVGLPGGPAWFRVSPGATGLRLTARLTAMRDLPTLVARVRRLFDLDADPVGIDSALSADPVGAVLVAARPGIRVPGSVDPAEMLVRAVVGQQVSVTAARTALGRLAERVGTPVQTEMGPTRLFPTPAQIVTLGAEALPGPRSRRETLLAVCRDLADGTLSLDVGDDTAEQAQRLSTYRGIGPWTTGYLAMRVLGDPDVLLTGDLAVRRGAQVSGFASDAPALLTRAAALTPWRSYLSMHLWAAAGSEPPAAQPVRVEESS
ncbi:AlkA N-terminal domain-containing protein [Nakamurella leprariae]|uniref:DNA-3-methyladenine glycosylase II n=1 Tax=Nakamurella leprariae TaxID=2803911 RepID=A0A938YEN5_9ACTN|nr:AlkA N-terminal domain-containing protein [Nakamurella leprariae]MBM9466460.1 DNA-3-methyladenine glycosylase 2 family protein [Nakamurella leprariae]